MQFTPGDWKFLMVLEGSNHVFEVRINDLESQDVPKYGARASVGLLVVGVRRGAEVLTLSGLVVAIDLAVDRIPFRHWDVYRRRKQPLTTATYAQPSAPQPSSALAVG